MAADIIATIINVKRDPKKEPIASDEVVRDWLREDDEPQRTPEEINEIVDAHIAGAKASANHNRTPAIDHRRDQ